METVHLQDNFIPFPFPSPSSTNFPMLPQKKKPTFQAFPSKNKCKYTFYLFL